jgi:hypothetical protein
MSWRRSRRTIARRPSRPGCGASRPIGPGTLAPFDWFEHLRLPDRAEPTSRRRATAAAGIPAPASRSSRRSPSMTGALSRPSAERCAILGADGYLREPDDAAAALARPALRLEMPVERFLEEIDFFVYFTHPLWRESFGRVIAEAIAAGKLVITDPCTARTVPATASSSSDGIGCRRRSSPSSSRHRGRYARRRCGEAQVGPRPLFAPSGSGRHAPRPTIIEAAPDGWAAGRPERCRPDAPCSCCETGGATPAGHRGSRRLREHSCAKLERGRPHRRRRDSRRPTCHRNAQLRPRTLPASRGRSTTSTRVVLIAAQAADRRPAHPVPPPRRRGADPGPARAIGAFASPAGGDRDQAPRSPTSLASIPRR